MPSKAPNADEEKVQPDEAVPSEDANPGVIQKQTAVFSWKDVVYEIPVKGGSRRILDFVDGWVKPGTLTALMVSNLDPSPLTFREYQALGRQRFLTFWLTESPWAS